MLKITVGSKPFTLENDTLKPGTFALNGESLKPDLVHLTGQNYHLIHKGRSYNLELIKAEGKKYQVKVNGKIVNAEVKTQLDLLLETMGLASAGTERISELKAPMPGLILEIKVEQGSTVKKGDPLLVLEAMKMENVIKAAGDGTVKEIKVQKGEKVEKNQVLLKF